MGRRESPLEPGHTAFYLLASYEIEEQPAGVFKAGGIKDRYSYLSTGQTRKGIGWELRIQKHSRERWMGSGRDRPVNQELHPSSSRCVVKREQNSKTRRRVATVFTGLPMSHA